MVYELISQFVWPYCCQIEHYSTWNVTPWFIHTQRSSARTSALWLSLDKSIKNVLEQDTPTDCLEQIISFGTLNMFLIAAPTK